MTGIYALWFEEPEMVYIGQSQDIKTRFIEHLHKLKNDRHTNYKVYDCYLKYGQPELVILEECLIEDSNTLEIAWTAEFDSIKKGLNIIEAGQVWYGTNSNASKYSRMQILRVFSLLYRTNLNYTEISKKCNVSKSLCQDVKSGDTHLWLKEAYPVKYVLMKNRKKYVNPGGDLTTFISPLGQEYTVKNVRDLARELFPDNWEVFRKGLSRIRTGKRKSYLGWTIKRP